MTKLFVTLTTFWLIHSRAFPFDMIVFSILDPSPKAESLFSSLDPGPKDEWGMVRQMKLHPKMTAKVTKKCWVENKNIHFIKLNRI